ncbi:MAG: DUF2149 domain-containing protein [Thermoguttaceae bacterium]|nr:DUF2149 domain-containing protein [Thermoguttaceae bacterium]
MPRRRFDNRYATILNERDDAEFEPLSNMFDAAFVFAVALLVALVSFLHAPDLLKNKDYTIITDPGTPEMKMVVKEGTEIRNYEATDAVGAGSGELLGRAYRLGDGRVVYVPKEAEPVYVAPEEPGDKE